MPPLRVGVGSDPSMFLPMAPGIAGQEVSPPLMGMTMQRSPLMVIMRFWSHWVMVTALPPRPPKLMSRRSRAPLMYTVLSLLLPIMVVRVLIFTSAVAAEEKHARRNAIARQLRKKRVIGGLPEKGWHWPEEIKSRLNSKQTWRNTT